ncbi:MAG: DNA polymerase III subunit alpha [Flavobacteriales bacterium]|nr:DNA polymerase III subunit alpha [Flavobacteriales bacterium]
MFIIFDTETTGFPKDYNAPITDSDNWPRMVQLAWQLHGADGQLISAQSHIVIPDGYTIPYNTVKVHGITTERAQADGIPLAEVLALFEADRARAKYAVGHNVEFDINVLGAENHRLGQPYPVAEMVKLDTKEISTDFCAIPGGRGGRFKWPTLTELHTKLFGEGFGDAHDAAYDVDATARCFFGLLTQGVAKVSEIAEPHKVKYEAPDLAEANFAKTELGPENATDLRDAKKADISAIQELPFAHLHCHTQFSILQSTSSIKQLVEKAKELEMPAVAMTDFGNMMAAFHFVRDALKADITPVVGCEFNVCADRKDKSRQDNGNQTVLLARNKRGYHNLAKLASVAYTEGFYYVPRIDKEVLKQYSGDIIATTGGLFGEVPNLILNVGETQAEEAFLWWKEQFGDDFYVELNRHGIDEEDVVNETLLKFAERHGVKYFAANTTFYTEKSDVKTHDVLLCVRDAESVHKPRKYIGKRGREYRYGMPEGNEEFYFKSGDEMKKLFADLPEAISTVGEILGKIERYELQRDVLLPKFGIPDEFLDTADNDDGGKRGENAYLRHLTYEGAAKRYPEITDEIRERLDFELETIARTGYPGYFLIVQDFCAEARRRDVSVGPGRGSAAGSAVAYCTGITNVDPIKYDLLFERFLNPDRVSLPDIDIDFDDEGRQRVIDYVIDKYGANQVAQIITYGTMAAKSSVRDAGRVMELPLGDTDRIAKLIPNMITLRKLFAMDEKTMKAKLRDTEIQGAKELIRLSEGTGLEAEVVNQARAIEGSVRNTGIHACGVIITPDDITDFVPVALAKDSDMWCTQFDNSVVEDAGLLKMDFLGLKTLTLIKDAIAIAKERYNVDIDPDEIPLDDEKTYELFQRGDTVGIFQYESPGMQAHMKELKPTAFDDLIAMNALYRPGPMEYIPSFIRRKHGLEDITYDLEASEEYLKETYGITVYQEQVMLLSQKLAGFTKGEADVLRKAMGKKIFALLETLKPKFLDGCESNGHDRKIAEKVWKDWEAFASYAFNKSHSTCYALVAFQTAYLKANYPAAYMASVLSNNMNDIKSVTFFMEECRRMGSPVLGPSVNESNLKFTVNENDEIRFGLAAIKGVGEGAVRAIVAERDANGPFKDVYNFVRRVDLRQCNKRVMEGLVLAGAFDCFEGIHRAQYLAPVGNNGQLFIEQLVKFGSAMQTAADAPPDLFGDAMAIEVQTPEAPPVEPWGNQDQLRREKEVVGIYISAHPLDDFRLEIENFSNGRLANLQKLEDIKGKELALPGMVSSVEHRTTKTGKPFGSFELEDFADVSKFFLFGEDYLKMKHFLLPGAFLFVRGKVQPRQWSKTEELEFKIHKMELLNDLRQKQTRKVTLEVRLDDLNNGLLEKLVGLVGKQKNGNSCPVEFRVLDPMRKLSIRMPSRSMKIDLSNETISQLDAMSEVRYALNS